MRYKFAYNEPGIGDFDIEGPGLTEDEAIRTIEEAYPTYVDIEILSKVEDLD